MRWSVIVLGHNIIHATQYKFSKNNKRIESIVRYQTVPIFRRSSLWSGGVRLMLLWWICPQQLRSNWFAAIRSHSSRFDVIPLSCVCCIFVFGIFCALLIIYMFCYYHFARFQKAKLNVLWWEREGIVSDQTAWSLLNIE